ncbi:MAG: hypothetical protein ACRESZ_00810 [Methylococcales bacterium]
MRSTRWQKLWLLTAFVLLFFPCIFILMEFPTQAKILKHWSTSALWKTQSEIPEYREIGVWYIRQQYQGLSDRELIAALESRFSGIDYSAIRNKHLERLENIRKDQCSVIAEAIGVYSFVITVLYANFWFVARILRKIRFPRLWKIV